MMTIKNEAMDVCGLTQISNYHSLKPLSRKVDISGDQLIITGGRSRPEILLDKFKNNSDIRSMIMICLTNQQETLKIELRNVLGGELCESKEVYNSSSGNTLSILTFKKSAFYDLVGSKSTKRTLSKLRLNKYEGPVKRSVIFRSIQDKENIEKITSPLFKHSDGIVYKVVFPNYDGHHSLDKEQLETLKVISND